MPAASRPIPLLFLLAVISGGCGETRDAPAPATPTATARRSPSAPGQATTAVAWTHDKLLGRLAGERIDVAGKRIRLDPGTLTCRGIGPATARHDGAAAWPRFRCIQPTFPPGKVVGPDAIFTVTPVDSSRIETSDERMTSY